MFKWLASSFLMIVMGSQVPSSYRRRERILPNLKQLGDGRCQMADGRRVTVVHSILWKSRNLKVAATFDPIEISQPEGCGYIQWSSIGHPHKSCLG